MCVCWPPATERVSSTRIFARRDGTRQLLVYQMEFSAREPVAMILPVPVALPAREDSLTFITLENNRGFFRHLGRVAPKPKEAGLTLAPQFAPNLGVVDVGDFVATFVPSVADFGRVDARFRLPETFWKGVPDYADWGFAVFQLKSAARKTTEPQPMAFSFETRSERLFFPTLHLHGEALKPNAQFDHSLFAQGVIEPSIPDEFTTEATDEIPLQPVSPSTAERIAAFGPGPSVPSDAGALFSAEDEGPAATMDTEWANGGITVGDFVSYPPLSAPRNACRGDVLDAFVGFVDPDARICRRELNGLRRNEDQWADCDPTTHIAKDGPWGTYDG